MNTETTAEYLTLYLEGRLAGETSAQARAGADAEIANYAEMGDNGSYSAWRGFSIDDGIAKIDADIRQHPDYDAASDRLLPKQRNRY